MYLVVYYNLAQVIWDILKHEDTISLPSFKRMNITDLLTGMSLESFFMFDLRNFLPGKKMITFKKFDQLLFSMVYALIVHRKNAINNVKCCSQLATSGSPWRMTVAMERHGQIVGFFHKIILHKITSFEDDL